LLPLECMRYPFMQKAMVALLLLAPMCAAMGVQVVNFRMAFFSDAISHSAFAGVALGLLFALNAHLAMVGFAVLVGLGITAVGRRTSLSVDTVIGVFFSTVIAFGLAVVYRSHLPPGELQKYLYGDILTISDADGAWIFALFVFLMAFQAFGYNRMMYLGLNPSLAAVHGVGVRAYQYAYAGLLALVVIFSVWAVGVLLVTAMLIVPAATARNLARSAGRMFWWSLVIGVASAVVGLLVSAQEWANTAPGATIILVAAVAFALSSALAAARNGRKG
jgi:zinc transport system permease protein